MKKMKCKRMLFLFLILPFALPNLVHAAEFEFGNTTKQDNVTKIPVSIKVEEGEEITTAKLGCTTENTEVKCTVEPTPSSGFTSASNMFTYTMGGNIPVGTHLFANLVITNDTTTRFSNLRVELKDSMIQGVTKSAYMNTVVGPKVEVVQSTDATLKSVKVSQGTMQPEFKNTTYDYTVYNIPDTVNSIRFTPACNGGDNTCDFSISGGKSVSGTSVTLNQGENKISIEVVASAGNKQTYTFTVYRGETSFNSAKLASLDFGDYALTPAFSSDTKEYTLTVPNTITNVDDILKYTLQDTNAKATVNGTDNFTVGTNTLTIKVDNANGDESITYKVTITRLSEENIEILKYINDEVTFKDADGSQMTLKMDVFKTTYPTMYEKIINNEFRFDADGNLITEEENKDDEVDTKKEEKEDKTWLIILLVVVGLAIIAGSGFLIFRKKKPKNEKGKKKEENEEKESLEEAEEIAKTEMTEEELGSDFSDDADKTVDVDEALSDLMNTKQYEFNTEEFKRIEEEDE